MSIYSQELALARDLAQQAGEVLMDFFGRAAVSQKSSQNLVTEADLASEAIITEGILKQYSNHLFLREEGDSTATGTEDHVWIIDPLDATNNYAHGIPHFSVSIAYARFGIPEIGIVWDPIRREEFRAERNFGAYLNDVSITTSTAAQLTESIIATGFYYDRGSLMERTLDGIRNLFRQNIRGIRRSGGAALDLSWVACGRFDAFFEYQLAPWDYAAGALLVTEAGGTCTDREGNKLELNSENIIASNQKLHEPLLRQVDWNHVKAGSPQQAEK